MRIDLRFFFVSIFALLGIAGGLLSCATSFEGLQAPEEVAARMTQKGGIDVAALRNGRAILVTDCTSCHRLYLPNEYKPQEWADIIPKMGRRASLTERQVRELETYIVNVITTMSPYNSPRL